MKTIDLCSAEMFCMELATRWVRLRRGKQMAPPFAVCDRHLVAVEAKVRAERDEELVLEISAPLAKPVMAVQQ